MEPQATPQGLQVPPGTNNNPVEHVVDVLADAATVRTAYGTAVDRDGSTVIPVASVRYGFGGGTGRKASKGEEGTGAGGGVQVTPVGYIVMRGGQVKFHRIRLAPAILRGVGLAIGAVFLLRGISMILPRRRG